LSFPGMKPEHESQYPEAEYGTNDLRHVVAF
jgi:hypothetical protein